MDETKQAIMEDVTRKMAQLQDMEQMTDFLKSNVQEFRYKEATYRVHKPNAVEKDALAKERMKKYISFLQDDAYMFRKQLVDLLKKKGVDISKMEQDAKQLYLKEQELHRKLAKTEIEKDVEALKKTIQEFREKASDIFVQKEEYLKYCIEKQLEDFVRFYLLYLVLEVKNGEAWERVYKAYEEFEAADDDLLLGRAAQVLAVIIYHDKL